VERGTPIGYAMLLGQDFPAAVRFAQERFGERSVFLLGHSLGGHLSALYAALNPGDQAGVVMVATASVYHRCYGLPGSLRVLLGTQFAALTSRALGYWPGDRLGFGGRQPAPLIRDWAVQARTGRFVLPATGEDVERRLGEFGGPVLAASVAGDRLAPVPAVDHLCEKLPSARLDRIHYTAADAGTERLDHFRWIRSGGPLATVVGTWMYKVSQGT
jgi:predicted alpha/beta hydrolase